MSELDIQTTDGKTAYRPGEEIAGQFAWSLDGETKAIELRLFWYTEGKGTQDVEIVDTKRIENPQRRDETEFTFPSPGSPYSFSGRLVSVVWALELVAEPYGDSTRLELTFSPTGKEIVLHG